MPQATIIFHRVFMGDSTARTRWRQQPNNLWNWSRTVYQGDIWLACDWCEALARRFLPRRRGGKMPSPVGGGGRIHLPLYRDETARLYRACGADWRARADSDGPLHHFIRPICYQSRSGWETEAVVPCFRYVRRRSSVERICTFGARSTNPMVMLYGYINHNVAMFPLEKTI